MFRNLLARHIALPFQDLYKGTYITRLIPFLEKSQLWDEEEMFLYRNNKFQKLISHSAKNVPYYRNLFREKELHPNNFKSLRDIQLLPVLQKETLRSCHAEFIADNISLDKRIKKGKTGGTSGVPLEFFSDIHDRSFTWASYYRWYKWMGIDLHNRVMTLWGAPEVLKTNYAGVLKGRLIDYFFNNKTINTFNSVYSDAGELYSSMIAYKPKLLKGYLSSLIFLANYMIDNGLPPHKNLTAVSSTSETLLPLYRDLLQNAFKVPVYNQYGCGEVSGIAYECSHHNGLHINEEHVIIEILDENDQPVFNKSGRIVVTSLDNLVMPFIRYDTGDMASAKSEKCDCGRISQLISPPSGRSARTLMLNDGRTVHAVFLTDIFYELGITTEKINRFQACQDDSGSLILKLEIREKLDINLKNSLIVALEKYFQDVIIEEKSFITPEPNGKFLYVKSNHRRP